MSGDELSGRLTDILLVVGGASASLLLILYGAFSLTSRRLKGEARHLSREVRDREISVADLKRSEARARALLRKSTDIMLVTTPTGVLRYASPSLRRVLGVEPATRLGRTLEDLLHRHDHATSEQLYATTLAGPGSEHRAHLRLRHANGRWHTFDVTATNDLLDPVVSGIVLNLHDVTEHATLEEQLASGAFQDALTGLANRALFRDRVTHAMRRVRGRRPMALLIIDLDGFRGINDVRGHIRGDQLLAAVARRVEQAIRPGDTAARLGGDTFGILVEETSSQHVATRIATRVLGALDKPLQVGGAPILVRASVGIAFSEEEQGIDEVMANAELAMEQAKETGGHRMVVYDAALRAEPPERATLRADLGLAVERSEFFLAFQPIFDIATRSAEGVEALLRWRHPTRGIVGAAEFVPLAEETGLITPIGAWVLRRACADVQILDGIGRRLSLTVNVSARQLEVDGFAEAVGRTLADTGLDPERLILDIRESALIDDIDAAATALAKLRSLGIRIAIDDFGTGYASLTYLHRLPVNIVKIDASFVASITSNPAQSKVVEAILQMARMLGIRTVAKGIEQDDQLTELARLGADQGQGFLLGHPLELVALIASLSAAAPPAAAKPIRRRRARTPETIAT